MTTVTLKTLNYFLTSLAIFRFLRFAMSTTGPSDVGNQRQNEKAQAPPASPAAREQSVNHSAANEWCNIGSYVFLPFVRLGFAAHNTIEDGPSTQTGSLVIPPIVSIGSGSETSEIKLTVRGPADVYGIASSQIVRTEPVSATTGFETNYFLLLNSLGQIFRAYSRRLAQLRATGKYGFG